MSTSPEQVPANPEQSSEKYESAAKQIEELSKSPENTLERSPHDGEVAQEQLKIEALKNAVSVEAGGNEKKTVINDTPAKKRGPIGKSQKEAALKRHLKDIEPDLTPVSKAFSKVIHNKAVEKTSDALGATVARPNAILSGAVMAFVLTLAVYVTAKIIGYRLSGFETIGAFIIGWILGISYDYLRALITGKSQ